MKKIREEKVLLKATACFLHRNGKILLARKTKKIGKGCRNGYGGGVEDDESIEACAIRELFEETGGVTTTVEDLEKIAIVHFHNTKSDGGSFICRVHFFLVTNWNGEVQETKEMSDPQWFSIDKLPFSEMMPADKEWLPIALSGKKIIAHAYLSPFQKESTQETVIEYVDAFEE